MLELTKNYYFIFGALTILGGVIGFVKAGSRASLIAGGVSGALILVAARLMMKDSTVQAGLILGLVLSALLEMRFLPAFVKTKKPMPAGMMAVLSMIGTVLSVLALVKK